MNWHHLQAFLWLRWRLLVNQLKRGGVAGAVILALLAVALGLGAAVLFLVLFLVGWLALPRAPSWVLLYLWDGLVVAFLFSWMAGLLVELQRSELFSLDKCRHLPVSLKGAFLINYLSSLLSVTLVLFTPSMVGLSLGLVLSKGPAMLVVFPLLASFLLVVTALSYQFQGWLAALMVNKRRRRTVIVLVTLSFVLFFQVPNLLNIIRPWRGPNQDELAAHFTEEEAELQRALSSGEITFNDYQQKKAELERRRLDQTYESDLQTLKQVERVTRIVNVIVPLGWLPLGAVDAADGDVLPAAAGALGLSLIGAASLWRSYRTTLRLYTGQFSKGKRPLVAPAPAPRSTKPPSRLLEKKLPWISEQASAIALCCFRSLLRAPEAKMLLLTPVILAIVFGSMLFTRSTVLPAAARPLVVYGATAAILLSFVQLVGNQFGFDRGGFRVFVLCPANRRDILLGKNLAVMPLAVGMGAVVVTVVEIVCPMRLDYFLAAWPQLLSMYLLFCMVANCLSILCPMRMAAGSMKPMNLKGVPLFLQFLFFFLFPLALTPTLLPLGIALPLEALGWAQALPVCLILSVAECVGIVYLYRFVLTLQARWLHAREQKILESVITKTE